MSLLNFMGKKKSRPVEEVPVHPDTNRRVLTDEEKKLLLQWSEGKKKELQEFKRIVLDTLKDKDDIIKVLLSLQDQIDITDEKDNPYTKEEYSRMTVSELTTILEGALGYLEKDLK